MSSADPQTADPQTADPQTADPQTAMNTLLDEVEALASLPHAAHRVIQIAEDEHFSAYDLAAVIATDTALTAKILRLANSAFYGYARQINTKRDVVVLLGFRTVRSTAIAAAVVDVFPSRGQEPFDPDLFWGHCTACAVIAEALARESGQVRPDVAFTAAILHDVGRLVLAQYESDRFHRVLQESLHDEAQLQEREVAEFGFDHAALGAEFAARWNLPDELVDAIARHHEAPTDGTADNPPHEVISLANSVCLEQGFWRGLDTDDGARVFPRPKISLEPVHEVLARQMGSVESMENRVQEFLREAVAREIRWYQLPMDPDGPEESGSSEAAA